MKSSWDSSTGRAGRLRERTLDERGRFEGSRITAPWWTRVRLIVVRETVSPWPWRRCQSFGSASASGPDLVLRGGGRRPGDFGLGLTGQALMMTARRSDMADPGPPRPFRCLEPGNLQARRSNKPQVSSMTCGFVVLAGSRPAAATQALSAASERYFSDIVTEY